MLTGSFSPSEGHGVISDAAAPSAVTSASRGPSSPAQNRTVKP